MAITEFPINTKVFSQLDEITDDQATDSDGVMFFDESSGVMKRITRGELFKNKVIPIDSVADFPALDTDTYSDRQQFSLGSFAPDGESGGGIMLWEPDLPKSLHDGVNYFSPTVPIPADFDNPTDVQNYMEGVGEEWPAGDGIFVLNYLLSLSEFNSLKDRVSQSEEEINDLDVRVTEAESDIADLDNRQFDTPAQAALSSLPVGAKYSTKGADAVGDGGHGDFIVSATAPTAEDGYSCYQLANGNFGVLQPVNGVVIPEQFGAVGDGVTDDTAALIRGQAYANAQGITYKGDGEYVFDALVGALNPQTDFDFSNAKIICSTVDPAIDQFSKTARIFNITGQRAVISVTQSEFNKGAKFVPSLAGYTGYIYIRSSVSAGLRWLSGSSSNITKRECCYVTNGFLSDELIWNWAGDTGFVVEHEPVRSRLTLRMPRFDLSGANLRAVVECSRSDTTVKDFTVLSGSGAASSFIQVNVCANFILDGANLPDSGGTEASLSYLLVLVATYNSLVSNANNQTGWSGINGNSFRKLTVRDSRVISVGSHEFSYDVNIENTTIYRDITIHGGGLLRVNNVKHLLYIATGTSGDLIRLRQDYGPHWEGTVEVDGVEARLGSLVQVYSLLTDYVPENEHGYKQYSPTRVTIKNVKVHYAQANPAQAMVVLALFVGGTVTAHLDDKYFNEHLLVDGLSADPELWVSTPSRLEYRLVDSPSALITNATVDNFRVGSIYWKFRNIKNIISSSLTSTSRSFFGVQPYSLPAGVATQNIDISNSDFVGIRLPTPFGIKARISNQKCVSLYHKIHALTSDLSSDFKFYNVELYGMNGTGTTTKEVNCSIKNCDVYHYSEITGVNPASATSVGFPDWGQLVDCSGCALHLPNFVNDAVANTLKTRINTNYKDPAVYDL